MPIRDYKCRVCNHIWEEFRKSNTDPDRCPVCKCDTVDRMISAPSGFNFKHGGFKEGYERKGK